jgi:hypothetical protein
MAKFLRLLLSVLLGLAVGSAVNMGLILVSGRVIPPPAGADVTTTEGLKASLHLFEVKHFLFPFLAHALGTLSGAFVAGWMTPGRSAIPAFVVGGFFLLGGVASVVMLPAPAWFSAVDLVMAYLPAAWLGQAWATRLHGGRPGGA